MRFLEKDYLAYTDWAVFLDYVKDWSLIALFPIISVFLNSNDRRAYFLLAAGIGLLFSILSVLKNINLNEFLEVKTRYGFSHSINHFALYIGTALIGVIIFGSRSINKNKLYLSIPLILSTLFCTLLLIKTQTRMAWIALFIVMVMILTAWLFLNNNDGAKRTEIPGAAFILLPCIFMIFLLKPIIESRFSTIEPEIRDGVVSSDHSINYRIELLKFGYEKWLEKPIFGHGPIPSKLLISHLGSDYISERGHLHNTYLEVMFSWGIVGLILCAATIFLLIKSVLLNLLRDKDCSAYHLFFLSSMLYWLLWSLSEFNVYRGSGQYYWLMLAGLGYSLCRHDGK